jgi:roadblock/LC7 domain-containing protein
MKFARRNLGLFLTSELSGRAPRRSRALRPTLGMECCEERTLLSIALVSVNAAGTASANSDSDFVSTTLDQQVAYDGTTQSNPGSLSADGTKLVFVSDGSDLVGSVNDPNQASNVFVRNTTTGVTSLVSATPGNGDSFDPVISPNGRYVAFISVATNLTAAAGQSGVGGDTLVPNPPAVGQLYLRDLQTGTTTLLDQTPSGQASDGFSTGQFVFSPDSTTLAWFDTSDNLTTATVDPLSRPNDAGQQPTYVYVRDLAAQTTSLVSASTSGQASGSFSQSDTTDLVFSPNSHSLVFGSSATDLTTNSPDNAPNPYAVLTEPSPENLFLRNLAAGTTTLLSVTTDGKLDVQGVSSGPVFSPDGNSVAFTSDVTDLTTNGTDFTPPTSSEAALSGNSLPPLNIFIRDLTTATTTLVTATPNGLQSSGLAQGPIFSPDGSELAFTSTGTDLTSNPLDPTPPPDSSQSIDGAPFTLPSDNVFVRNLAAGTTKLISVTPDGMMSNGEVGQVIFSPDGHYLAYTTDASDLTKNAFETSPPSVPGFSSNTLGWGQFPISNVFVTNLETGTTTLASATTNGQLSNAIASGLIFSPDSGSLYYTSDAIDLTSNPPDTSTANPSSPSSSITNPTLASATTNGPLSNAIDPTGNPTGAGGMPSSPTMPQSTSTVNPSSQSSSITNLFVYDLSAGTTSLISATTSGELSNSTNTGGEVPDASSINAFLSPDGQTLYFDSNAADLTAGDSNPNQSTEIFAASAPFTVANQLHFQSWESAAKESDGSVAVTVVRSSPATTAASVNYTVENGTAQAGTDFTATSGTLNFAAGQGSQTFTVPLIPADRFSGTRSAELVLSNPQGATLGYSSAELDLTANPPLPSPPVTTPTSPPVTTPTSPPVTTPTSSPQPGPTVVSVAPLNSRRDKTSLAITFDQALDPASAQNTTNYQVSLPGRALHVGHRHQTATRPRRMVGITTASYDPSTHEVTLTLGTKLRQGQAYQLQIKGAAGGLADTEGVALNSPGILKPGEDYLAALDLIARHS